MTSDSDALSNLPKEDSNISALILLPTLNPDLGPAHLMITKSYDIQPLFDRRTPLIC